MSLVPRLIGVVLGALALAGSGSAALADGAMPGGGGLVPLPIVLPPSVQDSLAQNNDGLGPAAPWQKPEPQSGSLDFFSVKPDSRSGDFTSLLGSGVSGGGLKFQLNW